MGNHKSLQRNSKSNKWQKWKFLCFTGKAESFSATRKFFIQRFSRESPERMRPNSSLRKPSTKLFSAFCHERKFAPEWWKRNILFPLIKSRFYSLYLKMEQQVAPNPLPYLRKQVSEENPIRSGKIFPWIGHWYVYTGQITLIMILYVPSSDVTFILHSLSVFFINCVASLIIFRRNFLMEI